MRYKIATNPLDDYQRIFKVCRVEDKRERIHITWDCKKSKRNDLDLIIVVRSEKKELDINTIFDVDNKDVCYFVYSRSDTVKGHIEYDRGISKYLYYLYPAHILDDGTIEVYNQDDGNNYIDARNAPVTLDEDIKSLCKFGYLWWPLGIIGWKKKAFIYVMRNSKRKGEDKVHYHILRGFAKHKKEELFTLNLTRASSELVIPLNLGEKIQFDLQDITVEEMSIIDCIKWKWSKFSAEYKKKKGV